MTAKKVEFPAKLVGYRIDHTHDRIVLFEETPVLFTDAEVQCRIAAYRALEAAGTIPYTFKLFSLEDLEAAKADIRADLERQLAQVRDWKPNDEGLIVVSATFWPCLSGAEAPADADASG